MLVRTPDGRTLCLHEAGDPRLLLHGEDDRYSSVAHGRRLAGAVPGTEARIRDDDRQLTLYERRVEEAHEWLLSHR